MPSEQSTTVLRIDRAWVRTGLRNGPRSTRQLGLTPDLARALAAEGTIVIDPDRFPGEYVPFNPMVCRLPGDERDWPGWSEWNV